MALGRGGVSEYTPLAQVILVPVNTDNLVFGSSEISAHMPIHIPVYNMVADCGVTARVGYGKGGGIKPNRSVTLKQSTEDPVTTLKKKLLETIIKEISAAVDEALGEDKNN